MYGITARLLTGTATVTQGKTLLYGFCVRVSVAGSVVDIYDGLDTESAKHLFSLTFGTNSPNQVVFHVPLRLENGLHVVLGSNVTNVSVIYNVERGDNPYPFDIISELEKALIAGE